MELTPPKQGLQDGPQPSFSHQCPLLEMFGIRAILPPCFDSKRSWIFDCCFKAKKRGQKSTRPTLPCRTWLHIDGVKVFWVNLAVAANMKARFKGIACSGFQGSLRIAPPGLRGFQGPARLPQRARGSAPSGGEPR